MPQQGRVCCSSPAAMCYWLAVSLVAWGLLGFLGGFWYPLRASSAATIFLAMAIGCIANWLRNRTLHCAITAPLFLIVGVVSLLSDTDTVRIDLRWLWPFVLIGVGAAFLIERRFAEVILAGRLARRVLCG